MKTGTRRSKTIDSVRIGDDLATLSAHIDWGAAVVFADRAAWETVPADVAGRTGTVRFASSTDIETLRAIELPHATQLVVGVGGGTALDTAKYVAWSHELPVTTVPTIASVDAMVTPAIAVRRNGRVRYVGNAAPREVLVDLSLLRRAPEALNRAGACDILSCHTARYDWALAESRGIDVRDHSIDAEAEMVLQRCTATAEEIRSVSTRGLTTVIESFCTINDLSLQWGSARMEEGSEHFFAYAMEYLTGRSFVHGELVGLGIVVTSILQENDPSGIAATIARCGVRFKPDEIGVTRREIERCLTALPSFVAENRHWYSVIDEDTWSAGAAIDSLYEVMDE